MLTQTTETLIAIEHNHKVFLEDLKKKYGSSLKGIIGKLEAQGFIVRESDKDKNLYYQLTQEGQSYIDTNLESLRKKDDVWDNKWTIVIFSIPESNRPSRDKLRRYLQKEGYGNLYSSAWISPKKSKKELDDIIKDLNISDQVVIIEGNVENNNKLIETAWKLQKIRADYENFIKYANKEIASLGRSSNDNDIKIKKLIFELALILTRDPGLPYGYLPKDWPKKEALKKYQEARKYLAQ